MALPSVNTITNDRWIGPLVLVTAFLMLSLGFHFAHAVPKRQSAPSSAATLLPATKLLPGSALYSLDTVSDGSNAETFGGSTHRSVSIEPSRSVTIGGWAVDNRSAQAAAGVFVEVDSKIVAGSYGVPRPDVAKAMANPLYTTSGFQVFIPASLLPKGSHDVTLDVYAHDGLGHYRDPNILNIVVR